MQHRACAALRIGHQALDLRALGEIGLEERVAAAPDLRVQQLEDVRRFVVVVLDAQVHEAREEARVLFRAPPLRELVEDLAGLDQRGVVLHGDDADLPVKNMIVRT